MPRPFSAEFRLPAAALVRAGNTITRTAEELGVSQAALHGWNEFQGLLKQAKASAKHDTVIIRRQALDLVKDLLL